MVDSINNNEESVIIVLHEIYGINQHLKLICEQYSSAGYHVLCPNFVKSGDYFDYSREEEAYQYFIEHIGFYTMVDEVKSILLKAKSDYKYVFLLGFSVGATSAWICSDLENSVDGIICYYGSRIRDYESITPNCPVLLIFAEEEKSFNVRELTSSLGQKKFVDVHVLNGKHGFNDPFSNRYNKKCQQIAKDLADGFLIRVKEGPEG
ncbi:dienelactone hydrolase family protein [Desulfosporosinus nitroreducens]|uniref:Dienelactone hydrolase family protein n=1 Tax=Desulfosporosinus nitroreducens TaxID=2018668 RepID=A0ABT8QLU8_9FIRM|nr:dienelactone hydrolase family protein [Desulfosporosinus nitroreducens]MCO1600715.1 dienelactone hydrolase family protein [Desulfosporosinus nitroreducens]MDO0822323.1 dienelactone hydrolase family protein [Desulfosporosinus nitroreducens]